MGALLTFTLSGVVKSVDDLVQSLERLTVQVWWELNPERRFDLFYLHNLLK